MSAGLDNRPIATHLSADQVERFRRRLGDEYGERQARAEELDNPVDHEPDLADVLRARSCEAMDVINAALAESVTAHTGSASIAVRQSPSNGWKSSRPQTCASPARPSGTASCAGCTPPRTATALNLLPDPPKRKRKMTVAPQPVGVGTAPVTVTRAVDADGLGLMAELLQAPTLVRSAPESVVGKSRCPWSAGRV